MAGRQIAELASASTCFLPAYSFPGTTREWKRRMAHSTFVQLSESGRPRRRLADVKRVPGAYYILMRYILPQLAGPARGEGRAMFLARCLGTLALRKTLPRLEPGKDVT